MMEMCYSCFMDTKYKCLRCELPICNKCSVFEENEDVEGWTAGKLYFSNSLTTLAVTSSVSTEKHGDACLFPYFNEV